MSGHLKPVASSLSLSVITREPALGLSRIFPHGPSGHVCVPLVCSCEPRPVATFCSCHRAVLRAVLKQLLMLRAASIRSGSRPSVSCWMLECRLLTLSSSNAGICSYANIYFPSMWLVPVDAAAPLQLSARLSCSRHIASGRCISIADHLDDPRVLWPPHCDMRAQTHSTM